MTMSPHFPMEKMDAYRDKELPPAEQEILGQHLTQCPACQEIWAETEAQSAIFNAFREAQAPPHFTEKVMTKIQAEPTLFARVWNALWPKPAFARWTLASGLALATALTLWLPPRATPPQQLSSHPQTSLSIYLADTTTAEEELQLGTTIEAYFL